MLDTMRWINSVGSFGPGLGDAMMLFLPYVQRSVLLKAWRLENQSQRTENMQCKAQESSASRLSPVEASAITVRIRIDCLDGPLLFIPAHECELTRDLRSSDIYFSPAYGCTEQYRRQQITTTTAQPVTALSSTSDADSPQIRDKRTSAPSSDDFDESGCRPAVRLPGY